MKEIQGKLICVALVQDFGSLRYFTGYCFRFRRIRAVSISFYEAELGPWLQYLSLRKENYLFHDANLQEQTSSIFEDYPNHAKCEVRIGGADPAMPDAFQHQETDHNYLHRRWEAAGWHYFYEHDEHGHTLVLSDDSLAAHAIEGVSDVLFHRHSGSQEEDAIGEWSPVRSIIPSSIALTGFDFKHPVPVEARDLTLNQQGEVLRIESHEYVGAYGFKNRADGNDLARLRMQEMDAAGKYIEAVGNNRRIVPGRWFSLTDRTGNFPFDDALDEDKNSFLILSVHHMATNNYLQQAEQAPHYANTLTCTRKAVPWRPGRGFNSVETRILAPQTATVVGPQGHGSIHTDQYGRIRVQFHWDRAGTWDGSSSAWMRYSTAWAGAQLGAAAVPRVGSEVLVQWLDGVPDRPLVTGAVHNESYMPPWELPSQQALSGLRSRETTPDGGNLAAGRSNHLILDDTNQRIQAQLKSDHEHSQLSLGHITRIEDNGGRKDARGEGWELASQAWGVARAGKGMLITTEARPRAASHIKDMGETVARLKQARERHQSLAASARESGAQEKHGQQADVADVIGAQNDAIAGAKGGQLGELSQPHLVLASPAGIETTTARSTHIASDEHTAFTTGKSLSFSSGDSLFASIRQSIRLFAHKAGMRLVAGAGDIDLKALSDSINLLAKLNITQTANCITITAKEELVLNGGGSYAKFNARGIEHGTGGSYVNHASKRDLTGPKKIAVVMPELPILQVPSEFSHQLCVGALLHADPELSGAIYEVWSKAEDAVLLAKGTLDDIGRSVTVFTKQAEEIDIFFGDNEWSDIIDIDSFNYDDAPERATRQPTGAAA